MTNLSTLSPDDASLRSDIQTETFAQAYRDVHSAEDIAQYCTQTFSTAEAASMLASSAFLCKSIHREGRIAGFYTISFQPSPIELPETSAELKQIYIFANFYGAGIGKSLFDDAILELKARSYSTIWLAVSDINYRARAFYERLGFVELGSGPIFHVGRDQLSSSILARKL